MKLFRLGKRTNLWNIILIIVLCFGTFYSHAQTHVLIHGVIKDQVTQLPIEGVNIQVNNTHSGAFTNREGVFELRVSAFPAILSVTHISYFGKQIIATQNKADSLIVLLSPKLVTLKETEITAETFIVLKSPNHAIIDYDFLDTNLLVLSYDFNKNRYELILTDEHFDTIAIKDIPAYKKAKQLFKDCMGNCHLLTNDSAYQMYFDEESITFLYPTDLKKFLNLIGNCLFETPNHLVFGDNTNEKPKQKLKLEYTAGNPNDLPSTRSKNEAWKHLFYFVNKETHEKTILDKVDESWKNRDAYENALLSFNSPHNTTHFGALLRFEELTFYKPSFQTVMFLNDTIYYFNHLKSQIEIYLDDLVLQKSIKVEYHNNKNWTPVIITDIFKNKAYTIFTAGAMHSLAEINLQDGSVKEVAIIKKLFLQKIKVNNGYLYFLYKDMSNDQGKIKLYQGEL